jgi:peptidyl-Lys metalloendopeptidase
MRRTLQRNTTWSITLALGGLLLGSCDGVDSTDEAALIDDAAIDDGLAADDIAVTLSASATKFRERDRVEVEVAFTNDSERPLSLLGWLTAADGLEDDLFEVAHGDAPIKYIGPHYKRPAPQAADYITLAPGETLTRTVDLTDFYDFSRSGDYRIRYAADPQGRADGPRAKSGRVEVWVSGRAAPRHDDVDAPRIGGVSYNKCTTTQQATAYEALGAAATMAAGAMTHLNAAPSATPRYTTWFGAFSTSGWNTAKTHFTAIKDAVDNKPIKIDCGCKKTYYAYVYPDQPYNVYVCKAFWSAPMSGTDSKGGTLIHELSHFTAVAGTDDHVYGQSGAKSLALSSPTQALNNADSHEYFAENTPAL